MSLLEHAPRFDAAGAAQLARELYRLDANAVPLPSERDQNFLLATPDGERFVLKVANALEPRELLEAQNRAMEQVAPLGFCPRVHAAASGDTILRVSGHFVRLLTWLPGTPLGTLEARPDALLEDLGQRLGELSTGLAGFDHPAIHRPFHWDLPGAFATIHEHARLIADPAVRGFVLRTAGYVQARDGTTLQQLRRSVIHGDANDFNVLVDAPSSGRPRVTGIIDFGDMVYSCTVVEPAVAAAYAVLDHPDPLSAAAAIVRGYHTRHPLTCDELSVLFGLVQLRLCLSVCMAAVQQRQRPDDEYLSISQAPIHRTLPSLTRIPPDVAEETFRIACGLTPGQVSPPVPVSLTLARRRERLGSNLSVAYAEPLKIVRGWMQYLFDDRGRRYLDAYNNVPHVGHSHPRVVRAAADQMRAVNTNTRYLHDTIWRFAERLCATLPDPLAVCFFVNSGSEANELALRLARAHTGARDLIVLDHAYHGNTTTLVDISPYKFNGRGGEGRPDWVHIAPCPDDYRGPHRRGDPVAGEKYGHDVGAIVAELRERQRPLAGFIAETCPSVAGQIVPPPRYLPTVYEHVRAAGGVCIADEVQTGLGRMSGAFYAFDLQAVVPDVVVLGKPLGNGYPLGAVVTTREIADSFDNGMEYFNTFGGSTVSCAAGLSVLETVEDEGLQVHAERVGGRLLAGLHDLASRHELIGDVRGSGLFLGVELVRDRDSLDPATVEAARMVEGLRQRGILLGTEGPFQNVLKIRPPLPFNEHDADLLIEVLDELLGHERPAGTLGT